MTPFAQLQSSDQISQENKNRLTSQMESFDPMSLLKKIRESQEAGYFCPTPRKGLIGSERLLSLLSEVGEEDASADSDALLKTLPSRERS